VHSTRARASLNVTLHTIVVSVNLNEVLRVYVDILVNVQATRWRLW